MIVNSMTKREDIDEYVNLIKLEPLKPVKPVQPTFSSIKIGATSSKNLTEDERQDLLMMRDDFKETMRTYREKSEALKALNLHILTTVDRSNLIYLMDDDTITVVKYPCQSRDMTKRETLSEKEY